ncbi:hypothetical protein ACFL5A_03625 [Gemmatimonadota bacterium]
MDLLYSRIGRTLGGPRLLRTLVIAGALWGATACYTTSMADNPFQESGRNVAVVVRVENRNLHDAKIFLNSGGNRREVGSVASRGVEFIEFGWPFQQPLGLEIELSVGERYRFQPRPIQGGGRMQLIIAPTLRQSSLTGY